MTIAEYLKSLSVESLVLATGLLGLFLIVILLQIRNTRWVSGLSQNQASREAKQRIERLISSVEKLTASPKSVSKRARPMNKGRKFVSALRAPKAIAPRKNKRS
ncbi:MAG: hypothetical protein ACOH12_03670 [Parvibaculaceae bacterium]